jgi:16S rRNA (adenine1518-N6/adenine1519-N6)-dimethyltransferase
VVRAKKSLGQNFLVDRNYQQRIVTALEAQPEDVVLEIGPGTGALTDLLAGTVRRLVAVEKDDALASALAERYAGRADVEIVNGDALQVDIAALLATPADARIIGNIPYNITSPLIFRMLERAHRPRRLVFMVQKEVADRIASPPGDRQYGALSVGVRTVADVERLFVVPRGAFRPVPNVDSAVLRIDPFRPPRLSADQERDVRSLARVAFGRRRKQLQRILRDAPEYALDAETVTALLADVNIQPAARPESLAPEDFVALAGALRAQGVPRDTSGGSDASEEWS